ncbi:uncharacterized protein P174DRAFT_446451 [Aspergillus novofumigatus IBT 16806]|uniref:Uncharacterized protein n=1 Tax=Aspergillus novofumigatus (strain IBT 16806) TaxID=1392255 RepID=A0A2I1BTD3_ASPN1|nr:uncharacterized protein P174DRAFT_446451 [Aspergillus novofumigatus IBT 16806]PKX88606.1 hypothetical protein P174DRAFT_446451 [Aspergillus novofumigatus IBT 16806]
MHLSTPLRRQCGIRPSMSYTTNHIHQIKTPYSPRRMLYLGSYTCSQPIQESRHPSDQLHPNNAFVVPGSCPQDEPRLSQSPPGLPLLAFSKKGTTAQPGSMIYFVFSNPDNQPRFEDENKHYAVFYHGLNTVSVPFDRKTNSSTIPERVDPESSIIMVTIADRQDAPTEESAVAGPLIILEQPRSLTLEEPTAV